MSADLALRRTASQLLAQGVDPYNTADELARRREQLADFAEWLQTPAEAEPEVLSCFLRRQAE